MLLYTCVAEFFSKMDTSGYLGFLSESLEGDTNVLQAFLGKSLYALGLGFCHCRNDTSIVNNMHISPVLQ